MPRGDSCSGAAEMTWQPKLTPEQRAIIEQVARLRYGIPEDKELSRMLGISVRSVRYIAHQTRVSIMTLETNSHMSTMAKTAAKCADDDRSDRIHDSQR